MDIFLLAICYLQSPTDFTPPLSKSDLKLVCYVIIVYGNIARRKMSKNAASVGDKKNLQLVCNVIILYGNLKSKNSQDYFPETSTKLYVYEFGF